MSEYGRRVDLKVYLDIWKWPDASLIATEEISHSLLNYRFQKTIKSPEGSCQISMLPQIQEKHIMDIIKPMDVIRIVEFGTLKFIGYVQRVSYSGSIGSDGKPSRNSVITCQQMGGLLAYASIGLGLGTALGRTDDGMQAAATALQVSIANAVKDGTSFAELAKLALNEFYTYIKTISSDAAKLAGRKDTGINLTTYLDAYFDVSALVAKDFPVTPRSFELFQGTEQSLTFWQVVEQLVERPFNELWIDNGPRTVNIEGKEVKLPPDKACLVFRPAPFNGSQRDGADPSAFDAIDPVHIDSDHLLSFDLSRSMDEVYTSYTVREAAFDYGDTLRLLAGKFRVDNDRVGQYLLKPLMTDLYFSRLEKPSDGLAETTAATLEGAALNASNTLYNWFSNNDQYLSGAISMMVPTDPDKDPKIGQKISVYGLEGHFYVEGIAHTWSYQGPMKTDLTVTRGFNGNKPMVLTDKIFNRSVIR